MAAGPGSKPSVCRYIQRCSFLKEGPREKLIFGVGTVTTKEESKGPHDSERPQAPSLQAAWGRGGPRIATAWASLVRGHFASHGREVPGKRGLPNCSSAQLPEPPQTETPALPAERSARAAWLPGEEGIPPPTLTPAMQCALPSVPSREAQRGNYKTHSALRGQRTFLRLRNRNRSLKRLFLFPLSECEALRLLLLL